MKEILKNIKNICLLIVGLNVLYLLLLTIAYIPSNKAIQANVDYSIALIEAEGLYPTIGKWKWDNNGSTAHMMLDNATDRTMLSTTVRNTNNPFTAAIDANGYGRYWHGYVSVLRPLLLLMRYDQIRYLNIFVLFFLTFIAVYVLIKKINVLAGVSFLVSLSMVHSNLFKYSMQFSLVFILMLIIIIITCLYAVRWKGKECFFFFLIIGSVTNFYDFLTAPLVTLIYPLAVYYFLQLKNQTAISNGFLFVLKNSMAWGLGYAITWISKWLIVWLAQGKSTIDLVNSQIQFRLFGGEGYPLDRLGTLVTNFRFMFPPIAITFAVITLIVWLILLTVYHRPAKSFVSMLPILIVCLYPYLWYLVLSNHSQIHYWFTFRSQGGSVFTGLLFLIFSLNYDKLFADAESRIKKISLFKNIYANDNIEIVNQKKTKKPR